MKRLRIMGATAVGLLIAASLVAAVRQPSALDVARGDCAERGFPAENLALLGYRVGGSPPDQRQTVEFQIKGADPPKKVALVLRRPVYFLPWKVVDFREEVQQ